MPQINIITQESVYLKLLDPGDVVLADRGFNVTEDIELQWSKT